jgi:hypothetical protein
MRARQLYSTQTTQHLYEFNSKEPAGILRVEKCNITKFHPGWQLEFA